ncbi:hypothetical protein HDU80_000904 [Chytriomyces hyalinus]|nr:hypothetical protein HDU80_000904 [Chytriomyces hyalinus]
MFASNLSALETMQADVTAIQDTQMSIISSQQRLLNRVQHVENQHEKFYTRLRDLPLELVVQIFAWVPAHTVFKYRRLSKTINEALLSTQFAVLNMYMPDFQDGSTDIGRLWFMLPPPYQTAVARALGSQVKRVVTRDDGKFKITLPESIKCLVAVKEIDLGHCNLIGTIADVFDTLTNLTTLDLQCNSLTGELPRSLCLLSGLITLNLAGNHLSGEFPALPNASLEALYISGNKFTGPIPTLLGNPHKLKYLRAKNNLFNSIPAAIGQFSSLEILSISENPISSKMPSEIWSLGTLQVLEMASCNMFGSLAGVGALRNLMHLDMYKNQLSGTFPSREISRIHTLTALHLSQNQFSACVRKQLDINGMRWLSTVCVDPNISVKGSLKCFHYHYMVTNRPDDSDSDSELESESELDTSESAGFESETDSMED